MSPAQKTGRLRDIATQIRLHRQHVVAAELAVRGLDPEREEIVFEEQREAVSELLQDIAQRMDEHASGIMRDAKEAEAA